MVDMYSPKSKAVMYSAKQQLILGSYTVLTAGGLVQKTPTIYTVRSYDPDTQIVRLYNTPPEIDFHIYSDWWADCTALGHQSLWWGKTILPLSVYLALSPNSPYTNKLEQING